jgi:predicted phage replisome organizer
MADVSWIKLKTDMFSDEKIEFIESMPEGDSIIVIWLKLLTLAGKCNSGGFIMLSDNIAYTEQMLVNKFKRSNLVVNLAIRTFLELGMIEDINGRFFRFFGG